MLRQNKPLDRRKNVLFIDASSQFKRGRNQNTLEDEHVEQIFSWYKDFHDVEGAVKLAPFDDIAENEFNLNIPLYVEPVFGEEEISLKEALADLKESIKESFEAEENLRILLKDGGFL